MSTLTPHISPKSDAETRHVRFGGLIEISALAGLYVAYSATRLLANDDVRVATRHARDVLGVESLFGLNIESWLNGIATASDWVAIPMSYWYAALHYIVTPSVMLWIYCRRRHDYARARNALLIGTALGLSGYILFPTAPPRLMVSGYADTLAQYSNVGWWSAHASAPAGLGGLTNELAAMPSLHVGWALWAAWAMYPHLGRVGRLIAILYPIGTAVVVVATGNHWVIDGLAGALVICLGIFVSNKLAARSVAPAGFTVKVHRNVVSRSDRTESLMPPTGRFDEPRRALRSVPIARCSTACP